MVARRTAAKAAAKAEDQATKVENGPAAEAEPEQQQQQAAEEQNAAQEQQDSAVVIDASNTKADNESAAVDSAEANNNTAAAQQENDAAGDESATQLNGTASSAAAAEPQDKSANNFDNDSAAVVQYLSTVRFTCGPLPLAKMHTKAMADILSAVSCYQIHVPRVLNTEEQNRQLFATLDAECFTAESATEVMEQLKELFADDDMVKVAHWPEQKIFYNDYHYMNLDDKLHLRQKEGMLTAGYHKLRDRWVVLAGVEDDVTNDKIKELIGADAVSVFRRDRTKRVYVRMDTKESNLAALGTTIKLNNKSYKCQALRPHYSERRGPNSMPQQQNFYRGNPKQQQFQQQQPYYGQQAPMMMPQPYNLQYGQPPAPQYGYYGPPQGPSQYYGNQQKRPVNGFYGAGAQQAGGYYNNGPNYQQKRARY